MGIITINGKKYEFTNEKNILTIIRNAGIDLPTLCYQPELSTFGACRLCTVEDDHGKTFAACSEEPRDGMVIYTHTGKLRRNRKLIVELLLAAHCRDCTTCDSHGQCVLQQLANKLGINNIRFENNRETQPVDFTSHAIVRDPNKCVLCGNCVRACSEIQSLGVLGFINRGVETVVGPAFNRPLGETNCVGCGQCRVVCPTGAITIHHSTGAGFWDALDDPNTRVVAQIAPAVRVAVGDAFGLPRGNSSMGKIVAALHKMGFDEVYDTTYTADLTIMEESAEFLQRVAAGEKLPLLTSCCPGWVKFVENEFPEFKNNISTCRSPQGMFSAILKEYYRQPENQKNKKKTFVVSIMPCTAKKLEAERPDYMTFGERDTDYVMTTEELIRMINGFGFSFEELDSEACDMPFGIGSGGGVIFGVSGGVTEAVLRRLVNGSSSADYNAIAESGVRGKDGIREFTVPYNGIDVSICVASGLGNARKVLDQVKSGEKQYHLIEVMACPGGCVMGGGQPHGGTKIQRCESRTKGLYSADGASAIKKSNDNPLMQMFYQGPMAEKAHELLHTRHE